MQNICGFGIFFVPLQEILVMKKHLLCILSLLFCFASFGVAQNNTSSPYSRFGYGELNDNVPGAYRALGGVGIGMRSNKVINPSQPASFSAVDSTSFMMDLAASAMWTNYTDASGTRNRGNGNLEYLTIQFPIWKYIGLSVGVTPYSSVGYDFAIADSINSDYHYTKSYGGSGGITQVYGGLSFNIMDWVALGANVYYMFGEISNTRALSFTESGLSTVAQTSTLRANDVRFRYGMQFFHTFGDHSFTLGGIYEHPTAFNVEYKQIETTTNDTVATDNTGFGLPMVYGAGLSYNWANRLTIAADYTMTDWSKAQYFGSQESLRNRSKIAVGVEYVHNPMGRKYWEVMPFRLGVNISDSYIKNVSAKDFSVSVGLGFPLHNVGTVINTTFEYGHRGTQSILSENYLRFTVNASINEHWFFKRKL